MLAKILPAYTPNVKICLLHDQKLKTFRNEKQKAWDETGALKGIWQTHDWEKGSDGKTPGK